MRFLFHNFHGNLHRWKSQFLHFAKVNLMYEICLHKTRLILVRFRNNLQCILYNFWFENISYPRNSYSMEPISTTILKIHHQNKEIYQHSLSETKKFSDWKRFENITHFSIAALTFIRTFLPLILVSCETCVRELIKMQ